MPEYHAMPEYRHIFLSPEYRHILSPEYRHTSCHHIGSPHTTEQFNRARSAIFLCRVVVGGGGVVVVQ